MTVEVYDRAEIDAKFATLPHGGNQGGITPPILADDFPVADDLINLPAIRRRLRMTPDLLDYGSPADASTAFESAFVDMAAHGMRRLFVPAAQYILNRPVTVDRGFIIEGEARVGTVLNVEHASNGFSFTGANGGGGGVRNLAMLKRFATSGGNAVQAVANANGTAPDGLILEDLWISYLSTGVWDQAIVLHGGNRNPTSGLQGIRDLNVSRVITFGTRYYAMYLLNVRGANFSQVLCNGVGGNSNIAVLGNSANPQDVSNGVTFDGMIFGQLIMNNTNGLVGTCLPQGGFNKGGGISNSKLVVPTNYWNIGPSQGNGGGLELV